MKTTAPTSPQVALAQKLINAELELATQKDTPGGKDITPWELRNALTTLKVEDSKVDDPKITRSEVREVVNGVLDTYGSHLPKETVAALLEYAAAQGVAAPPGSMSPFALKVASAQGTRLWEQTLESIASKVGWFKQGSRVESKETWKLVTLLYLHMANHEKLTDQQKQWALSQTKDSFEFVIAAAVFGVLPGGTMVPFAAQMLPDKWLPSGFRSDQAKEGE